MSTLQASQTMFEKILEKIRTTIRKAAPDAEETIKYGMPTFTLNGNLVHFAAFKKHIGLYPAPRGIESFKDELSVYEGAKSTVRFQLDKPIPLDLISRIVKFRVKKNLEESRSKREEAIKNIGYPLLSRKTAIAGDSRFVSG